MYPAGARFGLEAVIMREADGVPGPALFLIAERA
jgi:hypothetical protein